MKTQPSEIHSGDANIFAELGLPDADTHFLKAQIVAELGLGHNLSFCNKEDPHRTLDKSDWRLSSQLGQSLPRMMLQKFRRV